jgi:hypothetical protein
MAIFEGFCLSLEHLPTNDGMDEHEDRAGIEGRDYESRSSAIGSGLIELHFVTLGQNILHAVLRVGEGQVLSRFARDLIVAETGFRRLRDAGITLIAADAPNSFLDVTPTSTFIRQVLAAVGSVLI